MCSRSEKQPLWHLSTPLEINVATNDFANMPLEEQVKILSTPTPQELAFFAERQRLGLGVGRSENGQIETQQEVNAREAATAPCGACHPSLR